jgi:hypothetical protein
LRNISLQYQNKFHSAVDVTLASEQDNLAKRRLMRLSRAKPKHQHYETEGDLLRLVESLQKKQQEGEWQDNFILREAETEYSIAGNEEK